MDAEDGKKSQWNGAKTPGVKAEILQERMPLDSAKGKANVMAQDRADIGFAAKEISKNMSDPALTDVVPLKRLGRFFYS